MCDGCGSNFDLSHALFCKKGGLVTRHHSEIRDAIANASSLVWNQIRIEPIVRDLEANTSDNSPALFADIGICSVWLPQVEELMDVRVVDTDSQSYLDHLPKEVLKSADSEKRRMYVAACQEQSAQFTSLCFLLIVCGEEKLSGL